jgi:hypothetical protein
MKKLIPVAPPSKAKVRKYLGSVVNRRPGTMPSSIMNIKPSFHCICMPSFLNVKKKLVPSLKKQNWAKQSTVTGGWGLFSPSLRYALQGLRRDVENNLRPG